MGTPSFSIRGLVTGIDRCAIEGVFHPSVVLTIDVDGAFTKIIMPDGVLRQAKDVVVGRAVDVSGKVLNFPAHRVHFATELRLLHAVQ
jgi:hypothetical protein